MSHPAPLTACCNCEEGDRRGVSTKKPSATALSLHCLSSSITVTESARQGQHIGKLANGWMLSSPLWVGSSWRHDIVCCAGLDWTDSAPHGWHAKPHATTLEAQLQCMMLLPPTRLQTQTTTATRNAASKHTAVLPGAHSPGGGAHQEVLQAVTSNQP